jgi:hypothetical protein
MPKTVPYLIKMVIILQIASRDFLKNDNYLEGQPQTLLTRRAGSV